MNKSGFNSNLRSDYEQNLRQLFLKSEVYIELLKRILVGK